MNLSFSTRGWEWLRWEDYLADAEEMRFGGIELYNVQKRPELTEKGAPLHKYEIAATARALRGKKLRIPCLDTSCDLSSDETAVPALLSLFDMARDLGVGCVSAAALTENEPAVRAAMDTLLPAAEQKGVTLLLKTSGIYSDTARLRALMDSFACDQLAALWDIHHPYRDHGESAQETIRNLGAYVRHVHLRDSDDRNTYNLIGEGTLPVDEMMPVRLEEGRARGADLPAGARPHGRGIPRPVRLQVHDARLHRTYEEFREDVDTFARALIALGVKQGSNVAIWATNVPAVVHHLLGRDEDRRGARHGQHGLQDPRGRVSAHPVGHAHARHDRRLSDSTTRPS
jgi:sugar phosphate isomerase/epimerase